MTKTEKEMMSNLHDIEEIEKNEENFRNEKEEYIVDRDNDHNFNERVIEATNYNDIFDQENISNFKYPAAMSQNDMKSKIMDHIDVLILESSSGKNVLKNKTRININPPPSDDHCMCCGRHISELTPYGKTGYPLSNDFEDESLVKRFRTIVPCKKMAEKAYNQAIKLMKNSGNTSDDLLDWMIKIFGKEIGEQYYYCLEGYSQVVSCWECRECSVSEGDVYLREL